MMKIFAGKVSFYVISCTKSPIEQLLRITKQNVYSETIVTGYAMFSDVFGLYK